MGVEWNSQCGELPGIYLVVCAGVAVPGQNAMCSESPLAAACCAGAESSGGVDRKMCRVLLYAAVCCACAVTSGGLAILMCRALIYAAGCCASLSAAATGRPSILICHTLIHAAVCCSCAAAPGSLAEYSAWLFAAGCCRSCSRSCTCATRRLCASLCHTLLCAVPALLCLTALLGMLL